MWALQRQGMILEEDRNKLARDKNFATHRLLQSIARMDYQCLNKPIRWVDNSGEHTGLYHPMDLMHFLVKNLDIPSRGKLYQKLAICKLALPVLFPNKSDKGHIYMDMSLRQVKTAWVSEGHIVEGDVTKAPIPLISMIRCGHQSSESFSKSKLANDLFKFKYDTDFGSCGFFTKESLASNGLREASEGTVEGIWFEGKSNLDKFPASFGLLNLRGDALQHIQTATTLASLSDIVFMFCDEDIFKDDLYETMLRETAEKLKLKDDGEKKISKLVLICTKNAQRKVDQNRALFQDICKILKGKIIDANYQKFLASINDAIRDSLRGASIYSTTPLSARLRRENKESRAVNIESAKQINDSFIKLMVKIKSENEDQRLILRESHFPLQSTTRYYAQTQRKEHRSRNIDKKRELGNELIAIRRGRYEKIQKGLPKLMSSFLKELFNLRTVDQKLMFIYDIQYSLDEWRCKNLSSIQMQYSESLKKLALLKEEEIENKKKNINNEEMTNKQKEPIQAETKWCTNLSKLLLDISVGIDNIFREIGEICETTKINDDNSLIKELDECNKKLPEFAAALLMYGAAIELMDGDGLSVATGWLEEVMKALEKRFKYTFDLKKDPKIFVLTILGTQSTGKSTLLNAMFGIHFPVSAGRCTTGAFMQFKPIFLDNFPYDALLIIDTEGLDAPEYRQDKTHDNEIATLVLGISDLAIINVRGEVPTNIENFLEVSICALMRISMVDFHPSVVFVHQNCDPTAKQKNLKGRSIFMAEMDKAVSIQAELIQEQDRFFCLQDIVDISLENDFVYFPQFLEGSPPMSPLNVDYSKSCSNLTRYIFSKMKKHFERYNNAQTLQEFAEKIKFVWNGVLEENFVLSLINTAEIQVKYDIDNQMSNWKVKMEGYMEDILENSCNEIESDFKAKELTSDLLRVKKEQLEVASHIAHSEQKKDFINHVDKQILHKTLYRKRVQSCIDKMNKNRLRIIEDCQRRLTDFYNHEKNGAEWRDELKQIKSKVQDHARQTAIKLLSKKDKKTGETIAPEFSDLEIENEFQTFWSSVKDGYISREQKTYVPDNIPQKFYQEIGLKYGKVAGFKKISDKFGLHLQNKFKIEWVKFSHVVFIGNILSKNYKKYRISETEFLQNMCKLTTTVEDNLLSNVIGLCNIGGLTKMHFQPDSAIFDCGRLVKQYLTKALDVLEETHKKSPQKKLYNLTCTFKAIFLFYAAQLAVPKFVEAQKSFINYKDISVKLDTARENIKQIFTLILKKEGTHTIVAKQITKRLHGALRNAVLKQIRTPCKDMLLHLVTQKIHVHGLVLHDVISMLENTISKENVNYVQEYFRYPLRVFRKKLLHIFDGYPEIRLNDIIREKFDAATRKVGEFAEKKLKASEQSSLIQVICQNDYIRSLGVGEIDFDGIVMPKYNNDQTLSLAKSCSELSDAEKEWIKKDVKKRMDDESDIIEKLKKLIPDTDEVNTDITLHKQSEIKEKVISDISNHLFQCDKTCPLCHSPCNETHPEGVGPDSQHKSQCHRPEGFAGFRDDESEIFSTSFCNESVMSDRKFRGPATDYDWVYYRDYRTVNDYYKSWNIEGMASDDSLYWKYITYQVTENLNQFFPGSEKPDISSWGKISKSEAIKTINRLFHLDANTIAKNKDGFHYIKTS